MTAKLTKAITRAANQIHAEFDCLSDHVMTKKQIKTQIAAIIFKHISAILPIATLEAENASLRKEIENQISINLLRSINIYEKLRGRLEVKK